MKKIVVLGAGRIGKAVAIDLNNQFQVTVADIDANQLDGLKTYREIQTIKANLSDKTKIKKAIKDADLVIGAVPGFMGYETLKTVIETGKNMVDISFFGEDPFTLNELARGKNVTAIVDCGVAPGMSHMILGRYNEEMSIEYFECLVGGLPVKRSWPYYYKAPFSPIDVIEEYTRPARLVENGKIVIKPALSDPELVDIDPVGTLEAFNTDGLRTLLQTMQIPFMKERTLRYPGHIDAIRILRKTGLFNKEPIEINESQIRPIDLTTKLLFPLWKLQKDEPELTVMRVLIRGQKEGKTKTLTYRLYDEFDSNTQTSSMARTTGYTCTAVAHLVIEGTYDRKGISPPEYVGMDNNCYKKIVDHLEERNVIFKKEENPT
jgi:lysine 6-dehydrogenase